MGGKRKPPQARDRLIGARLRAVRREQTDLSLERAAQRIGWSLATMSRIETGKKHISTEVVAALLVLYGVPAADRDELIDAARVGNSSGWWDRRIPGVSAEVGTLASYEADATRLTQWSVAVIPGLLQTYRYAAGFMTVEGVPADDIEIRWMARLRRQQILGRVDYTPFIGQLALQVPFGGAAALGEQLEHLLAGYDRGVASRIVPCRVPHSALLHSWLLLEFPDAPPIVHVELQDGSVYLNDREVVIYHSLVSRLDQVALPRAESKLLIEQTLREL